MLIKWIGSKIVPDKLVAKCANYYESVVFGEIRINLGDHVLITKEGSANRVAALGCDVAKILYMYEATNDDLGDDKYRAIVQWYSRPQEIPLRLFADDVVMDFEKEVVQDFRPFDDNVSIETVFMKCNVIFGDVKDCATDIIQASSEQELTYACRYAVQKIKPRVTFVLIPVMDLVNAINEAESTNPRSCTKKNKAGIYSEQEEPAKVTPRRGRRASRVISNDELEEGRRSTPRRNKTLQKMEEETKSPRTPRTRKPNLLATPKSSKIKIIKEVTETPHNVIENNENMIQETWSIKRKSTSSIIRDITNSVSKQENCMSPVIPIVSPIKLVNIAKLSKMNNPENRPLNFDDITAELDSDEELDVMKINRSNRKPAAKKLGVRRNLNDSLNYDSNGPDDIDVENIPKVRYSVILDKKKPIKLKLRVSGDSKTKEKSDSNNSSSGNNTPPKTKNIKDLDMSFAITSPLVKLEQMNLDGKISINLSNNSDSITNTSDAMDQGTPRSARSTRTRKVNSRYSNDYILSPTKQKHEEATPKTRAKRNLKSDSLSNTPQKMELLSNAEKFNSTTPVKAKRIEELLETPKRRRRTEPKTPETTPGLRMKQFKAGTMTPTMQARESQNTPSSGLNLARERLHVSAVPKSLPCRENEFNDIFTFIQGKILDRSGGCMYISGVPGTGKTATVTEVIRCLQKQTKEKKLPKFDFIEVNGMRLTEPRQTYVHIYRQMEGKTVPWEQALTALDKKFTTSGKTKTSTVLLVDELDILCTRRQDVVYTILDWPSKANAKLIVVTIANTMDLPERLLRAKVTSRLGLTRRTFAPYSHKQLMDIVMSRLSGIDSFNSDAVQLVARKVAAVSGDARRALDICRRATEIAEFSNELNKSSGKKAESAVVSMVHVNKALSEMISSAKVTAIQTCSAFEKIFMQAVAAEVARTGVEETTFGCVLPHISSLCALEGLPTLPASTALAVCCRLGSRRLLITESGRSDLNLKVLLNVGSDDLHYALQQHVC